MIKSNFFIIGAPRCGTTSLSSWLSEHTDIFFSALKEPHYFDTGNEHYRPVTSQAEYDALFASATETQIAIGEGSTNYLCSKTAIPNILRYNPDAKFIVCLRHPIDAARSMYAYRKRNLAHEAETFFEAWKLQKRQRIAQSQPATQAPAYLDLYAYGQQLERLYNRVAPDNILVLFSEDMKSNPQASYQKALTFLGVADDGRSSFQNLHAAADLRRPGLYKLMKALSRLKKKLGSKRNLGLHKLAAQFYSKPQKVVEQIDESLKAELLNSFGPEITKTEKILGIDLSHWKN